FKQGHQLHGAFGLREKAEELFFVTSELGAGLNRFLKGLSEFGGVVFPVFQVVLLELNLGAAGINDEIVRLEDDLAKISEVFLFFDDSFGITGIGLLLRLSRFIREGNRKSG